jgi:hypothetical protein
MSTCERPPAFGWMDNLALSRDLDIDLAWRNSEVGTKLQNELVYVT